MLAILMKDLLSRPILFTTDSIVPKTIKRHTNSKTLEDCLKFFLTNVPLSTMVFHMNIVYDMSKEEIRLLLEADCYNILIESTIRRIYEMSNPNSIKYWLFQDILSP